VRPNPGRQIQELVTASDTVTTLAMPMKRRFRISGSGVLQWYDLGDARYYPQNLELDFYNGSSEIVGIQNSSGTVWERVPPRWGITCVLADNSTAAGVWQVFWRPCIDPRSGGYYVTDFGGVFSGSPYSYYSESGWNGVVSGGSNSGSTGADGTSAFGVARNNSGGAGTFALFYGYRRKTIGDGPRHISHRVSVNVNNNAVEEFVPRIGLSDNISGGAPTNGCIFYLDVNAYGNVWVCRTVSAAGNNTTATAVTPGVDPTYNVLSMEVSAAAARVDYWIDKALVATHSTAANIPTGVQLPHSSGIAKIAGANARTLYTDYIASGYFPTVRR
jgi:hypothetical protein